MATDYRKSLGWYALQAQEADLRRQQAAQQAQMLQEDAQREAVWGRNMDIAKQLQAADASRFDRELKMADMAGKIDAAGEGAAPEYENPVLAERARLSGKNWFVDRQQEEKLLQQKNEAMLHRLITGGDIKLGLQNDRQEADRVKQRLNFLAQNLNEPDLKEARLRGNVTMPEVLKIYDGSASPEELADIDRRWNEGLRLHNADKDRRAASSASKVVNDFSGLTAGSRTKFQGESSGYAKLSDLAARARESLKPELFGAPGMAMDIATSIGNFLGPVFRKDRQAPEWAQQYGVKQAEALTNVGEFVKSIQLVKSAQASSDKEFANIARIAASVKFGDDGKLDLSTVNMPQVIAAIQAYEALSAEAKARIDGYLREGMPVGKPDAGGGDDGAAAIRALEEKLQALKDEYENAPE